jgi:benzoyl-CoA 2,3-dioxygenase component A
VTAAPTLPVLARQHLIDPEVCIRCNTCEESSSKGAITHDRRSYAVAFEKCDACGDCLPPCPTGAIDSWRRVAQPFSIEEQLGWESLPADQEAGDATAPTPDLPAAVVELVRTATAAQGGPAPPPWSAAHPYVGLYGPDRPAVATVAGNLRLTGPSSEVDIRHLVLDFGKMAFPVLEGQSIGILPPGVDADGKPHRMRLYSVASPRDGERPGHNNLALTVKRVTHDADGREVRGVASGYLCDLAKGDEVTVTGPYGASFLMPNHPGAKLLMICTGTGAAPMRAMTERRRRRLGRNEGGSILLFFGARRRSELPYFGPLMKLPRELIDVELTFSREPGMPRAYVQDRMLLRRDDVAKLLSDEEAFIYLCGHKRMEEGVFAALADIARSTGLDWETAKRRMRQEGRLHVETY